MNKLFLKLCYEGQSNKVKWGNYFAIYTILFLGVAGLCFMGFLASNKSIIWGADGLKQHYTSLAYFGKYLRGIFRTFLSTGKISIPLWDFSIGYGSDVLSTLNYYVVGDPLNLLSVFVPASRTEYLFNFLVVFRMYLAGISFSCFSKIMNRGRFATLCGAFAYVFCSFGLNAAGRHPFFLNPMIYLPLLLIGIEKIFAKKKPYFFIGMVFVSAISNFYFFYMLSILIVIYAVIRFLFMCKESKLKNFFIYLRNFIVFYMTGLFFACITFIPNIIALLSSERFSMDVEKSFFYNNHYYSRIFYNFLTNQRMDGWTALGCSVIIFPAIVILFMKVKKNQELKIGFIILMLITTLPFLGRVMNGFSYPSNRWEWGLCFLLAFILTTMIPDLLKLKKKQVVIISITLILYFIIFIVINKNKEIPHIYRPSWIILLVTLLILFVISYIHHRKIRNVKVFKTLSYISVFSVTVASVLAYSHFTFSPDGSKMQEYINRGSAYSYVVNGADGEAGKIDDKSFWRYEILDMSESTIASNMAMLNGVNGTSFYLSQSNGNIYSGLKEMAGRFYHSYSYKGLDNRAIPSTLANVKYMIAPKDKVGNIFYGYKPYKETESSERNYQIYENQNSLPFGYTYSKYISKDLYESLGSLQKQEALLQGAVLDDKEAANLEKIIPKTEQSIEEISIFCKKGVTYKNGVFYVKKPSKVTIALDGKSNSETYLLLENLLYKGRDKRASKAKIKVSSGEVRKYLFLLSPDRNFFEGARDNAVNLGFNEKPLKKIQITFMNKGTYSVDRIKVISQSLDSYPSKVQELKKDILENPKFETNKISGNISLSSSKLLCMSIPYSKGWTAYVDGKRTEVIKTNTMFSGILLAEGDHNIELVYFTPGLKVGLICILLGIISLLGIVIYYKKYNRDNSK